MKTYFLIGLALLGAQLSFAQNTRRIAEVFIQIEDRGNYTVYLDNEFMGSSKGKFRFYDVNEGKPILSILQGNKRIYSNAVTIRPSERLILSYTQSRGLRIIKTLKIYRNGYYALDDFDGYIDTYQTEIDPVLPSRPNRNSEFETLNNLVKKEAFDDNKIKLIQAYTVHSGVSTAQAALLLKNFTFDDKKLIIAKNLSPVITDPQLYFTLSDSFTFLPTKEEFLKYLSGQQTSRPAQAMRNSTFEQLALAVKKEAFDDNKTKLIQAAIQNTSPSTAQMLDLLKLYSFEDKALNCAKMAYNFVSDKQRYFTIKEVFKFPNNQNEFLAYLGQR